MMHLLQWNVFSVFLLATAGSQTASHLNCTLAWQHLLVLLQVRRYPCNCAWAGSCDSQGGGMPPTRMSLAAQGGSLAAASNSPACEADSHQEAARTSMQGLEQHQPCSSTAPNHSTWNGDSHVALETLSLTKGSQHLAQQDAEGYKSRDAQDSHFYEHIEPEAQPPRASNHQPDGRNSGTQPSSGASADGQHESSQSSKAGQQMESRYVHGVYDIIAGHFSATRFAIWPKVRPTAVLPYGRSLVRYRCDHLTEPHTKPET